MNDFNKEELNYCLKAIRCYSVGPAPIELEYLQEKVMDMIANLDCEHEPSDKPYNFFQLKLCCKCGATYE